jgi:predicted ATPase/transcriptional regulator with XRE-family HTH domain
MAAPSATLFGDLLRRYRKAAGLTQSGLAERASLSLRGLNDLERGARTTPRRETARLLADALGLQGEERASFLSVARRPRSSASELPPNLPPESPSLPAGVAHKHNLPAQATPLLGRAREVTTLCALLQRDDVRLVTLTGPGGIGKTRLSLQVAAELLDVFPDGVWNVRLSRLTDPQLVVPTIATTLELKEGGATPLAEILREYLHDKLLLLVLDNFEHVVGAASGVGELLEYAPGLTVLVTSRVPLRLRGEREYGVKPLALPNPLHPPSLERLSQYAALALFIERAQAAQADFQVTNANAPAIAEICARLDGLPLAIELAAARVKLLPPPALLARLQKQLAVLTGGARDLDARQQTMRNTLAWSYKLLTLEEQRLFYRLSVFVGGCTIEAAEAVCIAPEGAESLQLELLDGLGALVDHNLIQQREEGGDPRFGMLHVIREFAIEQLDASAEAEALRRAHAQCFLELAERASPALTGPEAPAWMDRLNRDHNNLNAALGWASERRLEETGLRLVAALGLFWGGRGHLREGRLWAERLLAPETMDVRRAGDMVPISPPVGTRARALFAAGALALAQGDDAAAAAWLDEAVALGRLAGELNATADALISLGLMALNQGALELAAARFEDSLLECRELDYHLGVGFALGNLGIVANARGDVHLATTRLEEALSVFRKVGDQDYIAGCLVNLGELSRKRSDFAQALALQREALTLYRDLGYPRRCAAGLEALATSVGVAGQGKLAARLLGAAASVREALGAPQPAQEKAEVEQTLAAVRAALGEEAWQATFAAGRGLTLEEAIAEALGEDGQSVGRATEE